MVQVVTLARGYIGNILREVGDVFEWTAEEIAPWVKPLDTQEKPAASTGIVDGSLIPDDWKSLTAAERTDLASKLSGKEVATAKEADQIISAFALVASVQAEPFAEAPEATVLTGNGVQEALGTNAPDWVAPVSDGAPKPVTE